MRRIFSLLSLVLLLSACAGERLHREGLNALREGRIEDGLASLSRAVEEDPGNAEFRKDFQTARTTQVEKLLAAGRDFRRQGKHQEAEAVFRRILSIEPDNPRARAGIDEVARDRRHDAVVKEAREAAKAGDQSRAEAMLRVVLAENPDEPGAAALKRELDEIEARKTSASPSLRAKSARPANLQFVDAPVRMVFQALASQTGINFILDRDIRPDLKTTVILRDSPPEDAIDLILQTSQLRKKVLNGNTVLVYPNSAEKTKDYQDLVVKAFYLRNADAKQVQNTLKTLLKAKDAVIDEKLNLLVVRDTPEAVRLAERLVALHDISEPEVMLELDVVEVQRNRLLDLGIQWPNQLTLTPLASQAGGKLTLADLNRLTSGFVGAAIGDTTVKFQRDIVDSNILANPRIRTRNREKAKIMIGDRVPVVTTTTTATGFVAESVQYLDVGLKLEVEPDIHLADEVAIKVGLEVSSLVKEVRTPSGTLSYQIGTRNANTVLRLKDGETQILAGLINDQDRSTVSGIPGLADLPIIGRLFSGHKDDRSKTEIVLSITPRIVRNLVRPDAAAREFWSGTENSLDTRPLRLTARGSTPDDAGAQGSRAAGVREDLATTPPRNVILEWQGPARVKVGDTFQLVLRANADGGLRSLPFQLGYDTEAFHVASVIEGGFFKQDNGSTVFSGSIDPVQGKVMVSVGRNDSDGVAGGHALVLVTAKALAAKPKADFKVLMAKPLGLNATQPVTVLPAPYAPEIQP